MVTSRFSLRSLLLAMAGSAMFFAVVAQALRGKDWALGLAFSIGALLCILFVHVLFFLAAVLGNVLFRSLMPRQPVAGESSPFAQHRPPPQWVEPSEPES
jgi:predicted branched-subunit amino acid permease